MSSKSNYLNHFKIVLCQTSHPGNIGSTARAMKTMGFSNLVLVNPKEFPNLQADALASGAKDILRKAQVVDSIENALQKVNYVIGFTARKRELTQPHYHVREAAENLVSIAQNNQIAIVFGNEKNGLSNDELKHCQILGFIDANPKYSSLNIAQAVQIVCHEIRMMTTSPIHNQIQALKQKIFVPHKIQNGFYNHLEELLNQIGFLKKIQSQRLMQRLRLLFNRTQMEKEEINILRGILTEIQKKIK